MQIKKLFKFFFIFVMAPSAMLWGTDLTFERQSIGTGIDGASSVRAADMDLDGDIDIIHASEEDHKITWRENNGEESFTEHVITSSAIGANTVLPMDMDQDGDMDIAAAIGGEYVGDGQYSGFKVAWYENDGNMNFTEYEISSSTKRPVDVYVSDVDSDGDLDVISA